jgi:DNA-directed RNA polymerase subunit M/transcription elongation factor TFIIS
MAQDAQTKNAILERAYKLEHYRIKKFNFITNKQSKKLEEYIYEYCKEIHKISKLSDEYFINIYLEKISDIKFNLNPIKNPTLLYKIWNNEIPLIIIPSLSFYELSPTVWNTIIKKKENFEKNKDGTEDSTYQCRKCGSNRTFVYQLQTRSADEPMTTYIQCRKCWYKEKDRGYRG